MSLTAHFNRLLVPLTLAVCLPTLAAASNKPDLASTIPTARIKLDDHSMIIVPVTINGSGPYDFLLDTGSSATIIDQKLAAELALPKVGERKVMGVLGSSTMSVVRTNSVSVAGAAVADLSISTSDSRMTVTKVRGVLGQDFLQHFDVLINYDRLLVLLAPASGPLAQIFAGEHLSLHIDQSNPRHSAPNRLIVSGRVPELGTQDMALLLDSGANYFTVFKDNLGPLADRRQPASAGNFGSWKKSDVSSRRVRSLDLGGKSVPDLTVLAITNPGNADTDGLVPTSLFHSIFISTSGGFVILNPSPQRKPGN